MLNDDLKTLLATLKDDETAFQKNPKLNDLEMGTAEQLRDVLSGLINGKMQVTK